jgi:hypothetical protein
MTPLQVLFTGYAPVHFVCFQPLYQHLRATSGVEVWFGGGLRSASETGMRHDPHALFAPFGIPAERVLALEEIRARDFDLLFAANSKLIEPRSVVKRVQIFHGISFRNRAVRGKNMGCDHYFVVGPYMLRKFREAGLFGQDDPRALPIGFMKTDRLVNGTLDRRTLLEHYGFDGSRPVVLYAPTGLEHNSLETMGVEVVERLRASRSFDLLVKLHDHPKVTSVDWAARLAPLENEHTRIVREFDVIPPLFLADLLVTDASSVASEYALLDRPMVFLDVPELIAGALAKNGSMADLDCWGRRAGTLVSRPEDALGALDDALAHPERHGELRRAMASDLFFHPGRATEHAVAWMRECYALGA